jgi:hypothetical protein
VALCSRARAFGKRQPAQVIQRRDFSLGSDGVSTFKSGSGAADSVREVTASAASPARPGRRCECTGKCSRGYAPIVASAALRLAPSELRITSAPLAITSPSRAVTAAPVVIPPSGPCFGWRISCADITLVLPVFVRPSFDRDGVDKRRYHHAIDVEHNSTVGG